MKTVLLKQLKVIIAIVICAGIPIIVYAQEQKSENYNDKIIIRRSPAVHNIITMSYDETVGISQLRFNVPMEKVEISLYKDGELTHEERYDKLSSGHQEMISLPWSGKYVIIVTVDGETIFEEAITVIEN